MNKYIIFLITFFLCHTSYACTNTNTITIKQQTLLYGTIDLNHPHPSPLRINGNYWNGQSSIRFARHYGRHSGLCINVGKNGRMLKR